IKAERRAHLAAQRAERDAARKAAEIASSPRRALRAAMQAAAAAPAPEGGAPQETHAPLLPLIRWPLVIAQAALLVYLSVKLKSPGLFLAGGLWLGWRVMRRKFGWPSYFLALFVIGFVAGILHL
ncbi:hypothetical protein, partial [Ideonella azotifigens]